jgi:hypothetical protein
VAVGLVWTALGLERVFEGGLGWTVWAGVLVAALWPVSWGRIARAEGSSGAGVALPIRLAATPGRGPEAALCVVAVAFAVEALRIGEPAVTMAALGSLATIGLVAAGTRGRAAGPA